MTTISVDLIIRNLEDSIIKLWKRKSTIDQRVNNMFTNFYDRVIVMWHEKIIDDDNFAMRILDFYCSYKPYRYIDPDSELKNKIIQEGSNLIDEISKL